MFKFWISSQITSNDAKILWAQNLSTTSMDIIKVLKKEKDRVDYARYLLSGEIFLTGAKLCGNVTMFEFPEEIGKYRQTEDNIM